MLTMRRILRDLTEIGARVSVSPLAESSIAYNEIEREIRHELTERLSKAIYDEKIKTNITTWADSLAMAKIYRVHMWVLSDEELARVANEAYLQGVMDGRRENGLLNPRD